MKESAKEPWKTLAINFCNVNLKDKLVTQVVDVFTDDEK